VRARRRIVVYLRPRTHYTSPVNAKEEGTNGGNAKTFDKRPRELSGLGPQLPGRKKAKKLPPREQNEDLGASRTTDDKEFQLENFCQRDPREREGGERRNRRIGPPPISLARDSHRSEHV